METRTSWRFWSCAAEPLVVILCLLAGAPAATAQHHHPPVLRDWLVDPSGFEAEVVPISTGRELILQNGLTRRLFRLTPNLATVALDDLTTGTSLVRAVRPEARLVLDGQAYDVGGLVGQPNHAFLTREWLDEMTADPAAFRLDSYEFGEPVQRLEWRRVRHDEGRPWPPPGVHLKLRFRAPEDAPAAVQALTVTVHHELYDGIPLFCKWLTVHNGGTTPVDVDRFTAEVLALVEHGNTVETRGGVDLLPPERLHVETDYAFGGFTVRNATRHSVHWLTDPDFHTQVNYRKLTPCLLEVRPEVGPDQTLAPGETFESFRVFELVQDSTERGRRGLALRKMYRTVAPWVTENPLILHVVRSDDEGVRTAIDQAADCGFEMVSLSFGSGLNMESEDPAYRARFRTLVEYAGARGLHLGGYSLLSSRRIQPDGDNCVNPETGQPGGQTHGFCPALASDWGQSYFRKLHQFFQETGFLQFTHDGSYPGDLDAAARLPLQKGVDDSRWVQWKIITDWYRWGRAHGVYLRVPDYYYLSGSNECGMGYREVNWSLPRAQQVIHTRQNIYDGTWEKTPSMGWMFVPLTQYHGGGAAATIEPLDQHLDHYQRMLASNLGLGVQAVYRGTRLYDTERVRDAVRRWVAWFKEHRAILESDLIHGSSRRADGRDIDWMLHADPALDSKGMLVVYNPLPRPVSRTIKINLYYTGLQDAALVHPGDGAAERLEVRDDGVALLPVNVPARGMAWYRFEEAPAR